MIDDVKSNVVTVRTLQADDAAALLDFEIENRNWFERYVLARAASTYTPEGIVKHIDACLKDFAAGTMHPCLVLDDGKIIGRANLKDIDSVQGTTEVGYRIAEAYVGRGVATQALHYLMTLAYDEWKLTRVLAFATTENPASRRVLEKAGFVFRGMADEKAEVNQRLLQRCRYEHVRG
jgi:ribosomal-protein-alanine N-acetyltransferase